MTILRLALMLSSSLAAAAGATVPLSVAETGHVTVPVTIDEKGPFQFVIDSGAEGTAVYARFADEQRLATAPSSETLVGQTGTADVALVPLRTLALDGFVSRDISAVRLADRGDGLALDGIVGLDVLGDKTVDFDFRRRQVSLRADTAGRPRTGGIVATRVLGGLLAIPVEVNGARGLAVIDTGARETRVNRRFAQAAGLAADAGKAGGTIYGATNAAVEMASARTRDVTFAGVTLRDRPICIVDLPVFEQFGLADRPAMLLGADYLADQRMVIDFRDGRVWMK